MLIVDIGVRICGFWWECLFSYGYWFKQKLSSHAKLSRKFRRRLKDLLESCGAIKEIWEVFFFFHNRHLLVNDLIMKIKNEKARKYGTTDACVVTFFSIVFYYSNNSKSYFVDVFLHISLVWLLRRLRKGWNIRWRLKIHLKLTKCSVTIFNSSQIFEFFTSKFQGLPTLCLLNRLFLFLSISSYRWKKKIFFLSGDVWHSKKKRWKIIKLTNDLHYPYVEKTA